MKNIYLFVSMLMPLAGIAQDRIVLVTIDTINAKVIKSSPDEIEFIYPGEDAINVLPKYKIFKIEYASGRTEVIRPVDNFGVRENSAPPVVSRKKPVKPKFRWGLKAGVNLPIISNLDNGSVNKIGGLAGFTSELKFINTAHSIIFEAYVNQVMAENNGAGSGIEAAYLSIPVVYTNAPNERISLSMGLEPSFALYSNLAGYGGGYYDVSMVTNEAVLGITAGIRYFIVPKSWFLDFRGVAATNDMFTVVNGMPHKLNLSIGYFIKY